jgi:hypothetical protein
MNTREHTTTARSPTKELIAIVTWWYRSWRRPAGSISHWQQTR